MDLPGLITKLEQQHWFHRTITSVDASLPYCPHQRRKPARVTGRDEPRPHGNCPESPLT